MNLGLISFSFMNTPLEIREKIKFSSKDYHTAYEMLNNSSFLQGTVILSTCNRTELYFNKTINSAINNGMIDNISISKVNQEIYNILNKIFFIDKTMLTKYAIYKRGTSVIEHLFHVSSGLLSQVIGEEQILAQVKDALRISLEHQASDRNLNRLFQQAISTSKMVRSKTGISEKNLSISSVCVNYIENVLPNLVNKSILVIGVGEMSKIVLQLLQAQGISKIYATNRTHGKIVKIADYFDNLIVISYDQIAKIAVDVDIIISSTAAPHYVIKADDFEENYYSKKVDKSCSEGQKMIQIDNPNKIITGGKNTNTYDKNIDDNVVEICMFDLAVPRDIDPEIGKLPGVRLYNIDILTEEINKNHKYRLEESDKAEIIIKNDIKKIEEWFSWQEIVPVIKEIKRTNQEIIKEEIETLMDRIDIDDETNGEIVNFAEYLESKLFNRIILNMKTMVNKTDDEDIIEKLYDLLT